LDIIIISITAFLASGLTLISGFGLGTLLMPVIAIFFPLEIAIAITALVHFANNIFKLFLMGKEADKSIVIRFGTAAIIAAFAGAYLLGILTDVPPIYSYSMFNNLFYIEPVKLVIGSLILVFILLELSPNFSEIKINKKYLPIGGILSGFFGGLSGHQGAFRSMFLLKSGLTKEKFIATGVVIAVMVDITRMTIYGIKHLNFIGNTNIFLIIIASISAFMGAFMGKKYLKKITISVVRGLVTILLILIGIGLISGIL